MAQQQMAKDEKSLGELFTELASETSSLVRQEVSLAQTELVYKATKIGKNLGFLMVGGAVGYAAALSLIAGIIILLSYIIPLWAAALLVGVAIGVAAFLMISSAMAELRKTDPLPRNTVETIKEDAKWLKKELT